MSFLPSAEAREDAWTFSGREGASVRPAFLGDPVFIVATLLLVLNTLFFRPFWSGSFSFFACYWNDVLLIPVALPPVLWLQNLLHWREPRPRPGCREIIFHLVLWSLLLEGIFPFIFHHGTSDPLDVLAYASGALIAFFFWHFSRLRALRALRG